MTQLIPFLWKNENKKFTRLIASKFYRANNALFVSVDLIGEKNQVILEFCIKVKFKFTLGIIWKGY